MPNLWRTLIIEEITLNNNTLIWNDLLFFWCKITIKIILLENPPLKKSLFFFPSQNHVIPFSIRVFIFMLPRKHSMTSQPKNHAQFLGQIPSKLPYISHQVYDRDLFGVVKMWPFRSLGRCPATRSKGHDLNHLACFFFKGKCAVKMETHQIYHRFALFHPPPKKSG